MSPLKAMILQDLRGASDGLTCPQLAAMCGASADVIKVTISNMRKEGLAITLCGYPRHGREGPARYYYAGST